MEDYELFDRHTQTIIYGLQNAAVQRMLDFDYVCKRKSPSVVAIINPSQTIAVEFLKIFWGAKEIVIPIYKTLELATKKHSKADVLINFASFRSAYEISLEALQSKSIRTVVIIAEGYQNDKRDY